jgi:predicted nucleic acid-binding protein
MTTSDPPAIDASPLIVLAQGRLLDILRVAGSRIVVPEAVAIEVRQYGPDDPAVRALESVEWLDVVRVELRDARIRALRLGAGESEVLAWALAHPGAEAIIDDQAARHAADALGVPVRGTLGLVLAAKHQRIIPAARPVIDHLLRRTSWYLSERERERALRRVGE